MQTRCQRLKRHSDPWPLSAERRTSSWHHQAACECSPWRRWGYQQLRSRHQASSSSQSPIKPDECNHLKNQYSHSSDLNIGWPPVWQCQSIWQQLGKLQAMIKLGKNAREQNMHYKHAQKLETKQDSHVPTPRLSSNFCSSEEILATFINIIPSNFHCCNGTSQGSYK